jgi:protoporphyrinogen IX oxidase
VDYLVAKALHIIGVVTWFAGLFYVVRLFIYDVEARQRPESERAVLLPQLALMERRLWYGITWPAMLFTTAAALYLVLHHGRPLAEWLLVKYALVALLVAYHLVCGRIFRGLRAGTSRWTSGGLRIWNEVATLLLVSIVLVAVLKEYALTIWLPLSMAGVAVLLGGGIAAYKRLRR